MIGLDEPKTNLWEIEGKYLAVSQHETAAQRKNDSYKFIRSPLYATRSPGFAKGMMKKPAWARLILKMRIQQLLFMS